MHQGNCDSTDPEMSWASIRESTKGIEVIAGGVASAGPHFEAREVVDFQALVVSDDRGRIALDIRLPAPGRIEFEGTREELLLCLKRGPRLSDALTDPRFQLRAA